MVHPIPKATTPSHLSAQPVGHVLRPGQLCRVCITLVLSTYGGADVDAGTFILLSVAIRMPDDIA